MSCIGRCSDPLTLIDVNVLIEAYEDPALEGENITFSCPIGLVMIGPNSATCMKSGEWKPDPSVVICTGGSIIIVCCNNVPLSCHTYNIFQFTVKNTFVSISATCSNPLYVLQINDSIRTIKESPNSNLIDTHVCCSGLLITIVNTTTCLENGEWELETSQMNSKGIYRVIE